MSAPSQPNLTYLSKDSTAPSPVPTLRSELSTSVSSTESEISQQPQRPPSSTLPYIPDSVLKSLQPYTAATLPSSATQHPERTLSSAFSTASLGRRRKKSFNALRGGTGSELSAQRAELDERIAFLEYELTRYKTYSRLLEAELARLQRMSSQTPASPQTPYGGASNQTRGLWQVCGPTDLPEEPSGNEGVGAASPIVLGLPLQAKRGYCPSGLSGLRQTRSQRMQYRQYQMHRRQQQQQFYTPTLSLNNPSPNPFTIPSVQNTHTVEEAPEKKTETIPTAFYEILWKPVTVSTSYPILLCNSLSFNINSHYKSTPILSSQHLPLNLFFWLPPLLLLLLLLLLLMVTYALSLSASPFIIRSVSRPLNRNWCISMETGFYLTNALSPLQTSLCPTSMYAVAEYETGDVLFVFFFPFGFSCLPILLPLLQMLKSTFFTMVLLPPPLPSPILSDWPFWPTLCPFPDVFASVWQPIWHGTLRWIFMILPIAFYFISWIQNRLSWLSIRNVEKR